MQEYIKTSSCLASRICKDNIQDIMQTVTYPYRVLYAQASDDTDYVGFKVQEKTYNDDGTYTWEDLVNIDVNQKGDPMWVVFDGYGYYKEVVTESTFKSHYTLEG